MAGAHNFAGVHDMNLEIREEPVDSLREHGEIPIAFLVDKILEVPVLDGGLVGIVLKERAVDVAHVKDYDAIRGKGPHRRPKRFDASRPPRMRPSSGCVLLARQPQTR